MRRLLIAMVLVAGVLTLGLWIGARHLHELIASGALERAVLDLCREHLGVAPTSLELHFATFPEVSVERIVLPHLDQEVFRLDALRIRLDPSALLQRKLRIDEIRVVAPRIRLERAADGRWNLQDLAERIREHRRRRAEAMRSEFSKQAESVLREAEELRRGLPGDPEPEPSHARDGDDREGSGGEAPADPAPTQLPAGGEESPGPPTPGAGPRASPVELGRFRLERAEIVVVDRTVPGEPMVATFDRLGLVVDLPPGGRGRLQARLEAGLLGAPLEVDLGMELPERTGSAEIRLAGLPLGAVQPYLAARGLPVDPGRIPLAVEGTVRFGGGPPDYDLRVRVPRSTVRVERGETELAASFDIDLRVRPDQVDVTGVRLALGEAVGVALRGKVRDFKDPELDLELATERFDLAALVAMLPPATRERVQALSPRLDLALLAKVKGRPRSGRVIPELELGIGPGSLEPKLADVPLPVRLAPTRVRVAGDRLSLEGLELSVAGMPVLRAGLSAAPLSGLPDVELSVSVPALALDRVHPSLDGRIPLASDKAREGFARLAELGLAGSLGASLVVTAHLPVLTEVPGLSGVGDLRTLVARLKADPELAAGQRSPERVKARLRPGLVQTGLEHSRSGAGAPGKRGALEIPVRAELAVAGSLSEARLERLRVEALGATLQGKAALADPLGERTLEASLSLGDEAGEPLELAGLASRLPAPIRDKVAALGLAGTLGLSASARGPVTSPEVEASVALAGLDAKVQVPGGSAIPLHLDRLALSTDGHALKLPPAELTLPGGALRLSGEVDDLRGGRSFKARLRTPGTGLDLTRMFPHLPEESRVRIGKIGLDRADLRLQVDAGGTPAKPGIGAKLSLALPIGALELEGGIEDPAGSKALAVTLRTAGDGLRLEDVLPRLPPEIRDRIRGPVAGRLRLQVEAKGELARPEGLRIDAGVDAALPGGDVRLRARVTDPRGERETDLRLGARFSRLDELMAFLPEVLADKVREFQPSAEVVLDVGLSGDRRKLAGNARVGLSHAGAVVPGPPGGITVAVEPAEVRVDLEVEPREGQAPRIGVRGEVEVRAKAVHPEKGPFDFSLLAGDLRYDGVDLHLGRLTATSMEQSLVVTGSVRDVKGVRDLDLGLGLGVDLQQVMTRLVPAAAKMRSNGKIEVEARVGGSAARPDWEGRIELRDFFLDAFQLKGNPVEIERMRMRVTRDDLIVDPWELAMGGRESDFFLAGSMKELAKVDNLWAALKADREGVIARIKAVVEAKGGKKAVVKMVGNETLIRLLGGSSHKIIIHIEADDLARPYTFKTLLAPDETRDFDFRREEILAKYRELALKEVYDDRGMSRPIFGRHQAQVMAVRSVYTVVLDEAFNMVHPQRVPFWRLVTTPMKF